MRRPPLYSMLGCLAIGITALGYSVYIVQAPFNPLTIAITDFAVVCILLGMTLLILGYEVQNLQRINLRAASVTRPLPERSAFSPQPTSTARMRILRPEDFPPTPRRTLAQVSRGREDATEHHQPPGFSTSREALNLYEAEKRLEHLRGALQRAEHLRDKSAEEPRNLPAEPEKKILRPRVRPARSLASEVRSHGQDVRSFHVSLVGKDEIVLSSITTGEEVKFQCEDPEALEAAWRAFAKGEKVRPIIESGRIIRIDVD